MYMHPLQNEFDRLYKEITDLYHEDAVSRGISDSVQSILYTLCELGDGCLQKDICDRCFIPKQTVHSTVRKMEQTGLLTLTAGRGRDKHLSLTEAGRALAAQVVDPLVESEYQTMETLSPAEQEELIRLTKRYVAALRSHLRKAR